MTRRTSTLLISTMLGLILCQAWAGDDETASLQKRAAKFSANGTLDQVLAKVADLSGLRVSVDWPVLKAAGVDRREKLTYTAPQATVEQIIDMALARAAAKDHPLAWYLDGKVIRVSTQARVMYRQNLSAMDDTVVKPARTKASFTPKAVKFDNTPLVDVISYFRTMTDLNFDVNWKSLEEIGVAKDTPITVEAKDITRARLLDMVLDQVSANKDKFSRVYWVINDGVVTIATGGALNNDLTTRVLDVSDLLVVIPNFKGPVLDLASALNNNGNTGNNGNSGGGQSLLTNNQQQTNTKDTDDTNMAEARAKVRDNLMTAIKDSIGEDMWKPDGKGSISIIGGKMLISQTLLGFKLMDNAGRKR